MCFGDGSSIGQTMCKQYPPHRRQIMSSLTNDPRTEKIVIAITYPGHTATGLHQPTMSDVNCQTISYVAVQMKYQNDHQSDTFLICHTVHSHQIYTYFRSNPIVACSAMSAQHCAKTSVSREADFAPDLQSGVSQDPAKTVYHECSLSRLCAAAPVVASSSLEEVRRWLGQHLRIQDLEYQLAVLGIFQKQQ